MWVLNTAGMAIIFALVRSTTSTASGQRWAAKPYENPGGYARPATRPNVHAPPIHKRPHSVSTSRGPQSLSSPHPHRPEHYQPVTAPDQPGTEENPALLVMTGDMIEDNLMASIQEADIHKSPHTGMTSMMSGQHSQPESTETMTDNQPEHHHLPRLVKTQKPVEANIHKSPHTGMTSMMSGQHSQPESIETMTDDHPEHHHQPQPVKTQKPVKQEATIHQPPHTGVTSMMPGQHSLPDSTETMTDDHSEHHHQPRPVMTQKPRPISETPLMSSEAASEEPPMTPVMTEDIAIMQSEELPNAIESNKVMTEEMSEHDQMIPVHDQMISVQEFKEVLHEIVQDAVDKILTKKASIVGKLITAKQNLLGHDASRGPQLSFAHCVCDEDLFDRRGRGDCNSRSRDFNGRKWCYLETFSLCTDHMPSNQFPGRLWSHDACS